MKLHILGCSSVYPNRGQATSGYVIETTLGSLLIDCGHEVVSKLVEHYTLRDLTAVIVSHMHPDHYYGLFALSNRLHAERLHRLPLFLPPNGSQVLQDMAQAMGFDYDHMLDCFELSEYNPTRPPFLIGLTIQMKQTKHSINAYAMRLSESASGNHLVFTSDTAWFDGLAEFCLGAQLLLVEATEYPHPPASESVEHWHLTPEEAGHLIMEAQVEKALVTHYDARYSEAVLSAASGVSLTSHVVLAREHEEYVL